MRHFRSILCAVLLAPATWALIAYGLKHDDRPGDSMQPLIGLGLLVLGGIAYGILVLAPISPLGPLLAGVAFLVAAVTASEAPTGYAKLWSGWSSDLAWPGYQFAAVLAVPLLLTVLSARRWAGSSAQTPVLAGRNGRTDAPPASPTVGWPALPPWVAPPPPGEEQERTTVLRHAVQDDETTVLTRPADSEPATEDLPADEPTTETVRTDEPTASVEPITEDAQADERATEDVSAHERPTEDVSAHERPTEDVSAAERPTEDVSAAERPTEDVSAGERATADISADQRVTEQVSVDEGPTENVIADERPTEDVRSAESSTEGADDEGSAKSLPEEEPSTQVVLTGAGEPTVVLTAERPAEAGEPATAQTREPATAETDEPAEGEAGEPAAEQAEAEEAGHADVPAEPVAGVAAIDDERILVDAGAEVLAPDEAEVVVVEETTYLLVPAEDGERTQVIRPVAADPTTEVFGPVGERTVDIPHQRARPLPGETTTQVFGRPGEQTRHIVRQPAVAGPDETQVLRLPRRADDADHTQVLRSPAVSSAPLGRLPADEVEPARGSGDETDPVQRFQPIKLTDEEVAGRAERHLPTSIAGAESPNFGEDPTGRLLPLGPAPDEPTRTMTVMNLERPPEDDPEIPGPRRPQQIED